MKNKYKHRIRIELENVLTVCFPALDEEPLFGELLELIDKHVDDIAFDVDQLQNIGIH